jgi:hypothetical protein
VIIDQRFDDEFRNMTEADMAVIQQSGRYWAHEILKPLGLIKKDYLTPPELENLRGIFNLYGKNVPNVVLRGSTISALAELVSIGAADMSSLSHVEKFFDDMLKAQEVVK